MHIGPALMHSESTKKIVFIGLNWLGYFVEQGSALGFLVFQFILIEILLQSWKKMEFCVVILTNFEKVLLQPFSTTKFEVWLLLNAYSHQEKKLSTL